MDAGGLSFHVYYSTKKGLSSRQTHKPLSIHN
nr:MAG TPA: hypothetical protein [Caudoviricetes sp.]